MTTSEILKAAWKALESEPGRQAGVYERRVFAHSGFSLFAGLLRPAMQIRFSMDVPSTVPTDGLERETAGFVVVRQYGAAERSTRVSLSLTHTAFRELFEVMAQDVAARILATHDGSAAVTAMRDRLDHWERFMRAAGPEGLRREDQIGLFGELTFLGTMLRAGIPGALAVAWWTGPSGKNQDFQAGSRALEVKATTGNSATAVRISNELQLDDSDCESLYLLHLWLKEVDGGGADLPQLVDEIAGNLTGQAVHEFMDRLAMAGYHEVHRHLYAGTGYSERQRRYYLVEGTFPRICVGDLRPGVSGVKYTIDLAGVENSVRGESVALESLAGPPP